MRQLKIAAVQICGQRFEREMNYEKAKSYIGEAAKLGADMVLFPELYAGGYVPSTHVWDTAEEEDGPTFQFLRKMALLHHTAIGMGYLEKVGSHYCNNYLLIGPEGEVWGKAEKDRSEAYLFRRGHGRVLFDTPVGRIAIGICADNHFTDFVERLQSSKINLLLMPHGWAIPRIESNIMSEEVEQYHKDVKTFGEKMSKMIGVPSVFVNQIGPYTKMTGISGALQKPEAYSLAGYTKIVDQNGNTICSLEGQESIILADVSLDYESSIKETVPNYEGWVHKGVKWYRQWLLPLDIFIGKIYYRLFRK